MILPTLQRPRLKKLMAESRCIIQKLHYPGKSASSIPNAKLPLPIFAQKPPRLPDQIQGKRQKPIGNVRTMGEGRLQIEQ